MEIRLHANATTTPKQRAYIQQSTRPAAELAVELGTNQPIRGMCPLCRRVHQRPQITFPIGHIDKTGRWCPFGQVGHDRVPPNGYFP